MLVRHCNMCNLEKNLEKDFSKNKTMCGGREYQCRACRKILYSNRMSNPKNKEKKLLQVQQYKKTDQFKINRNIKEKKRRKDDIKYKMIHNLRSRSRKAFLGFYKDKTTKELIGCSLLELQSHIINRFQLGMTLENYGEWHLDHIIPLSSANDKEGLEKLCHYSNLQPLWAKDNLIKSNKCKD